MKKELINMSIVFLLTAFAWRGILTQGLLGEGGFAYFFKSPQTPLTYNFGPILLFQILETSFRDSFFFYQLFSLVSFSLIAVLFYFFVHEFTQRKDIALVAGILFGVNFTTSFEMLGIGAYGNLVERVFFLLPMLVSFTFFFRYINTKNKYYYLASLIICVTSVFLSHFNMFFITVFISYIFAIFVMNITNKRKVIPNLLLTIPFVFLSLVVVYLPIFFGTGGFLSGTNFFQYLFTQYQSILFHLSRQFVFITIPESILIQIVGTTPPLYKQGMEALFLPIILVYFLLYIFLLKKEKHLSIQITTSLVFLLIAFVLNMFMRGDNVDHLGVGSRYLFAPSIGFAVFWAITIVSFTKKFKKRILYFFIVLWVIYQSTIINNEIKKYSYNDIQTHEIITYLKKISPQLKEDSIVIVPNILGDYGANFANMYYGKKKTLFLPFYDKIDWLDQYGRPFDPKKDIILSYDNEKQVVVDRTKEYKSIIVQKKIK